MKWVKDAILMGPVRQVSIAYKGQRLGIAWANGWVFVGTFEVF